MGLKRSLLGAALLGCAASASANDGAIQGVGGTIDLMDEHPGIALIAEHVAATVDHRNGTVHVECLFVLRNSGEADTVRIGFPETYGGDTGPRPFRFFRSTVDGEPVACARIAEESGSERPPRHWWTRQVFFEAGETKVIRDVYESDAGFTVGDAHGAWRFFEYTLATGASWAGPIEAATVTFELAACDSTWNPTDFSPAPDFSDACAYTWRFRRFEPGRSGPPFIQVAWRVAPAGP